MDQNALKRTTNDITFDHLRSLLKVQTDLRDSAERQAQEVIHILVDLLQVLAPDVSERLQKDGSGLDGMPLSQIGEILNAKSRQLLSDMAALKRPQIEDAEAIIAKAYTKNTMLQSELKNARSQLAEIRSEVNRLHSENEALKKEKGKKVQTEPETHPPPPRIHEFAVPSAQGSSEPEWMKNWRNHIHFEKDSTAIVMLGKTGLARRPEIEQELGKRLKVAENSGTQPRILSRLRDAGMIRCEQAFETKGASSGGVHPDLLVLTDRGRSAYRYLTGEEAQPNEFARLQAAHVSAEHTLLNLEAADFLRGQGYSIVTTAPVIQLPDGGTFIPDLVAKKDDQMYFIEVEQSGSKSNPSRIKKWHNANTATAGRIFVFCDNQACMQGIREELLNIFGPKATFSLTNLEKLKDGQRKNGSIWLDVRTFVPYARHKPG